MSRVRIEYAQTEDDLPYLMADPACDIGIYLLPSSPSGEICGVVAVKDANHAKKIAQGTVCFPREIPAGACACFLIASKFMRIWFIIDNALKKEEVVRAGGGYV